MDTSLKCIGLTSKANDKSNLIKTTLILPFFLLNPQYCLLIDTRVHFMSERIGKEINKEQDLASLT